MAKRKFLGCGWVLLGSVCCVPAWGQSATLSERFLDNPPQTTARPASKPPGRRQPRAVDLPQASPNDAAPASTPEALEDEALNRKISGICRGC